MQVKIGIQSVPRELVVETEATSDAVEQALTAAIKDDSVFMLTEEKGGRIMVPAEKIAYVEISGAEPRRVGFGPTL